MAEKKILSRTKKDLKLKTNRESKTQGMTTVHINPTLKL